MNRNKKIQSFPKRMRPLSSSVMSWISAKRGGISKGGGGVGDDVGTRLLLAGEGAII